MRHADLKQEKNIETLISQFNLTEQEIKNLLEKAANYDKFFLIGEGKNTGILAVLTQHFHDPYMDLELDECDMIEYKGKIPDEVYLDILDDIFQNPQIARAKERQLTKFLKKGFEHIKNKKERGIATLQQVIKYLKENEIEMPDDKRIREITLDDLSKIKELFKKEYPARYRLVEQMYVPEACFLFEEDNEIKGVCFNEKRTDKNGENYLYSRQILVKESERGREIAGLLLKQSGWYALNQGIKTIRGNARDRAVVLYERFGAETLLENIEYYLIRYKLKK